MSIKRTITVDTLDDLAEFIGQQAKEYEDRAATYKKSRDSNPRHTTATSIAEARATALGLRLAQSIVEDTDFS